MDSPSSAAIEAGSSKSAKICILCILYTHMQCPVQRERCPVSDVRLFSSFMCSSLFLACVFGVMSSVIPDRQVVSCIHAYAMIQCAKFHDDMSAIGAFMWLTNSDVLQTILGLFYLGVRGTADSFDRDYQGTSLCFPRYALGRVYFAPYTDYRSFLMKMLSLSIHSLDTDCYGVRGDQVSIHIPRQRLVIRSVFPLSEIMCLLRSVEVLVDLAFRLHIGIISHCVSWCELPLKKWSYARGFWFVGY